MNMKKILFFVFALALLANFVSAENVCGDTNSDGFLDAVDLQNINSYAFEDVSVPEGVRADLDGNGYIDIFDVSIMISHLFRGGDAPNCGEEIVSCENAFVPSTLYDTTSENIYHDGEDRLQKILDDAGYNIDVDSDQTNIQVWNTLKDVKLEITYIKTISSYRHEFGYYFGMEAEEMYDIFTDDETVLNHAVPGDSFTVEIDSDEILGFYSESIRDDGMVYFTDNALNIDEKDRVVVYDLGDEFILAFEDWVDFDYQDLVVSVKVICDDEDDEDNDGQSHDSDSKMRVINLGGGFCEPNWECNGWSECLGGTQTRTCIDTNFCDNAYNKPNERTACELPVVENVFAEEEKNVPWILYFVIAILIILVVVLLVNFF